MFGHRISKVGYAFCAIGMTIVLLVSVLLSRLLAVFEASDAVVIANIVSAAGAWLILGGVVMIVYGILARGFERRAAANLTEAAKGE